MRTIALSDDEVVATAAMVDGRWMRPLMTVDTTDTKELALAVARGFRSLTLRGLMPTDVSKLPFGTEEIPVGQPMLRAYPVDHDGQVLPLERRVEYFGAADDRGAVLVHSLPLGIVVIETNEDVDVRRSVGEVIQETADAHGVALVDGRDGVQRRGYLVRGAEVGSLPGLAQVDDRPPETWQDAVASLTGRGDE